MGYVSSLRRLARSASRTAYSAYKSPIVRAGAKAAANYAFARYTQKKAKKSFTSGTGVTTQLDAKTIYRKKRMPRRQRKRWASFKNKVKAAQDDRGTTSITFSDQNNQFGTDTVGGTRRNLLQAVHLSGTNGGLFGWELGSQDLLRIVTNDDYVNDNESGKFTMKSAIMDVTVTNPTPSGELQYHGALEVDLYEISYGKKRPNLDSMTNVWNQGIANTTAAIAAQPKASIAFRGVSPFEMCESLSLAGMRIIKKTKYFISEGHSISYQMRDPRNTVYNVSDIKNPQVGYIGKRTRSILLVAKPVDVIGDNVTFNLLTKTSRHYKYTCDGLRDDRTAYIS